MVFEITLSLCSISCNKKAYKENVYCNDDSCYGTYSGPEFISGSDVAHQFSNIMSLKVGDKLKQLYKKGLYSKVDFSKIVMSTKGMGSGIVNYKLTIPFVKVKENCQAFTSFDHVGGWNHLPELENRKKSLKGALMKGDSLDISQLLSTKEGLKEYWIQWKNKEIQYKCNE
jgi:hypothetical protein